MSDVRPSPIFPPSLTLGEQLYCAAVILCTVPILMFLAIVHFLLIPDSEDPGVFFMVAAFYWIFFLTLSLTVGLNLAQRRLSLIPTVVQCGALCMTVWLIPIGIWGAVLLSQRRKREKSPSLVAGVE